jgi:type IV pilus assembly protein PilA
MRKQIGFSLIELLIVVSIILIIAAIAIPGLLKARISANQASAVESMRTIMTANSAYQSTFAIGYAPTMLALGGPNPAACAPGVPPSPAQFCFIDANLAAATTVASPKTGYVFSYKVGGVGNSTYTLNADAAVQGQSGDNHYFSDQTQVIRFNTLAVAVATDSALQ